MRSGDGGCLPDREGAKAMEPPFDDATTVLPALGSDACVLLVAR
jgi:hypothetical protein